MQELRVQRFELTSAHALLACFLVACSIGVAVIGSFPLAASIVTIFLFAGAHNVMEFRYFIARMPRRWGRSRTYYSAGIGGVIVLAAAYVTLYFTQGGWLWSESSAALATATWNTAFVLWLAALLYIRGRQRPRSDRSWALPAALIVSALAWITPQYWSLALVYIHPFIAMWFLDRQMRRSRPEWLTAYRWCLASIPLFVAMIWIAFGSSANLNDTTPLFARITQHAGSGIMPGLSSQALVATHVFLESIHYFVWILLIPLIDRRAIPWRLSDIPLMQTKGMVHKAVVGAVAASLIIVAALWIGFSVDYTTTRDVYFALAIGHVLAEFPFLIKML